MKDLKEKQEDKEEVNIQSLTGSPSPTAVSDVAKGGEAETDMEHTDEYQSEWIERLNKGENSDIACIQDAYSMLFESLAMITRMSKPKKELESED